MDHFFKMAYAKNWLFTVNNYTPEDISLFEEFPCNYLIFGKEIGEKGTPHLQGYVQLLSKKRLTGLKKIHATAHWEAARGTAQENITYCSKDGELFAKGTATHERQRSDLHRLREDIQRSPQSKRKLFDDHLETIAKYPRIADALHDVYHPPMDLDALENYWYVGPPGTGKSSTARKKFPEHFAKQPTKWFDGYDRQDTVILEELGPQHATLAPQLKIWADHYVFTAETKGSSRLIRPKRIIVTSNFTIDSIFPNQEDRDALHRRFKTINF